MNGIFWIALLASISSLALTIYIAHRKLLLIDFFLVSLAMIAAGGSFWQLLTGDANLLLVQFTIVTNLLLSCRQIKFPAK